MATSIIKGDIQGAFANVPDQPSSHPNATQYLVRNGVCYLYIYDNCTYQLNGSTWQKIGTLPIGCRPNYVHHDSWANRQGDTGEMYVDTNGNVYINSSATGKKFIALMSPILIG